MSYNINMVNNLGKIHIYTGEGKGKTTAALGLAMRAAGAGFKVYLIQFLKGQADSELKSLKKIKNIFIKKFGERSFIHKVGTPKDKIAALAAFNFSKKIIKSKKFNLVILDEIFLAIFFKLIAAADIVKLIKNKPAGLELVLTGRRAPKELIKLADYVTEMKEVKHPYQNGVLSRRGIEK